MYLYLAETVYLELRLSILVPLIGSVLWVVVIKVSIAETKEGLADILNVNFIFYEFLPKTAVGNISLNNDTGDDIVSGNKPHVSVVALSGTYRVTL